MVDTPRPIDGISDPDQIRVKLLASGQEVHAPMAAFAAASIHGAPTKATPVDADEFGYWDSVGLKTVKTTWVNIKATLKTYFDTLYQPLAATLTSWAAITRAAGFDTFTATPSSANLRSLLTDETGTGAAVFAGAPTITGIPVFSGVPSLTGGALTFPATQVPSAGANDLDDYEEGTFTPRIDGTTAAGAGTYSTQLGTYTKVGRTVHATGWLVWSAHTGTGNMVVDGLPFTAGAGGFIFPATFYISGLTFAATYLVGFLGAANTKITLRTVATGGAAADLAMDTAATLVFNVTYSV